MHPTKIIKFPYKDIQVSFRFQTDHVLVEVESLGMMFSAQEVEEALREVRKKIDSRI